MLRFGFLGFILLITLGFAQTPMQSYGRVQNTAVFLTKPSLFQMVPAPFTLKKPRIMLADWGGARAALRFVT